MKCGYALLALAGLVLAGAAQADMLPPVGGRSFGPIGGSNPEQVRIEQHFSIRIAPGGPVMPPDMMDDLMDERPERFEEKAMGKCFASGAVPGYDFDLLHAHDWQAALAPAFLHYAPGPGKVAKSIVTIHNSCCNSSVTTKSTVYILLNNGLYLSNRTRH